MKTKDHKKITTRADVKKRNNWNPDVVATLLHSKLLVVGTVSALSFQVSYYRKAVIYFTKPKAWRTFEIRTICICNIVSDRVIFHRLICEQWPENMFVLKRFNNRLVKKRIQNVNLLPPKQNSWLTFSMPKQFEFLYL